MPTVTQIQARLDLGEYGKLVWSEVEADEIVARRDRTVGDIAILLEGADKLVEKHGFYPDVTSYSDNLRRSSVSGALALLDVMPFYENGNRLIDDRPKNVLPHIQANLAYAREFVGRYGV